MFFRRKRPEATESDDCRAAHEQSERAREEQERLMREQAELEERDAVMRKLRYLELQAEVFARRDRDS